MDRTLFDERGENAAFAGRLSAPDMQTPAAASAAGVPFQAGGSLT